MDTPFILKSITTSEGDKVSFIITSTSSKNTELRLLRVEKLTNDQLISSYEFEYKDIYPYHLRNVELDDELASYEKRTFLEAIYPKSTGSTYSAGLTFDEAYKFDYYGVYDYFSELPGNRYSAADIYGYYTKKGAVSTEMSVVYYYPNSDGIKFFSDPLSSNSSINKIPEIKQTRELIPDLYYNPNLDPANQYRVEPLPSGHPSKQYEIVIDNPFVDRSVDPTSIHYGSLSKVTYPTGGSTRLFYESNTYFDPVANSTYYGPGIRLKRTIVNDGVSNVNNTITDYVYEDENGKTTGLMIAKPNYAFGTAYSLELMMTSAEIEASSTMTDVEKAEALSIRTNFNMSSGGSNVLYEKVGIKRMDQGITYFSYEIPATMEDTTSPLGDWVPTMNSISGLYLNSNSCLEFGRINWGSNVYPYASNPNYEFQRGLLKSVESYNEDGNPVSKKLYTYERNDMDGLNSFIYGMTIDKIPSYRANIGLPEDPLKSSEYFYAYGKYRLFVNTRNSVSKVENMVFDPDDSNKFLHSETNYTYNGAANRLSNTSTSNSDGTVVKSYVQYSADYNIGTSTSPDFATTMIDKLQQQHRNGIIIEQFSTVQEEGSTNETVVSGSIVKFNEFEDELVLPFQSYSLDNVAKIALSDFDKSVISNGNFEIDDHYELISTVTDYADKGKTESTFNNKAKIASGVHWDKINETVVTEIINGNASNFIYSSFSEETDHDFNYPAVNTPDLINGPRSGRTDKGYLWMRDTGIKMSGTFTKSAMTETMVLSYWLYAPTAGTMTCEIKSLDGATTYSSRNVSYAGLQEWIYFEELFDVSGLVENNYILTMTNTSELAIDDVLAYPEEASVSYRSFGTKRELLSESLAGKTTTYFTYDDRLRNTLVRDDDKNIISKTGYSDLTIQLPNNDASFYYVGTNDEGVSYFQLGDPGAVGNFNYIWNFNYHESDPDPEVVPMNGSNWITHEYDVTTNWQGDTVAHFNRIQLKVVEGEKSVYTTQSIVADPHPGVEICAAGPKVLNLCSNVAEELFNDGCVNNTGNQMAPTVFKIDADSEFFEWEPANISYSWQVWFLGSSTFWEEVGTEESVALQYDETFNVRCIVNFELEDTDPVDPPPLTPMEQAILWATAPWELDCFDLNLYGIDINSLPETRDPDPEFPAPTTTKNYSLITNFKTVRVYLSVPDCLEIK